MKPSHRRHWRWLLPMVSCSLLLSISCDGGSTIALTPQLILENTTLDFGEVPLRTIREVDLPIANVGRAPLAFFDIRVEPTDAPVKITSSPASLASDESGSISLAYAPAALGTLAATLRFSTDDPENAEISVSLLGRSTTQGKIEFDAAIDFEGQCEGTQALGHIEIRSSGTAALELTDISIHQAGEATFSLLGSTRTPLTVPLGESITLIIQHAPPFGAAEHTSAILFIESSDPDEPLLEIPLEARLDRAPIARIAPFPTLAPGAILTLDGTASSDPELEEPLAFAWSLSNAPTDSKTKISQPASPTASFEIDAAGAYTFELRVTDVQGCTSQPAEATALAQTAEALRFELFWDNLQSDLDLHLVPEPDDFFGPTDCYFAEGQLSPDWGVQGDSSDDPVLVRDALTGYGPEIISFPSPSSGRYRVLAHYFSAHHAPTPSTLATLRLYRFGVLVMEMRRTLAHEGAHWEALFVEWPGGNITLTDLCEACE